MSVMISPIDLIVVENRHRRDLGDLDSLRMSIFELGLLHPIVVDRDRKLVAGQRRLEACKQLGWETIEVNVVDTIDSAERLLTAERDENTCRKEMTPLELKALVDALLEIERPKAAERSGHFKRDAHVGTPSEIGNAVARAAEAAGTSRSTYQRISEVVDKASDLSVPEHVRAVAVEQVQKLETGEVTPGGAYKAVKEATDKPLAPRRPAEPSKQLNRNHVIRAAVAMERVLPQLHGITTALASIDFTDAEPEEADAWCVGLNSAITALKSTVKKIEDNK